MISLDATLEEYLEQASKLESLRRKKKDYQRQFDAKIRESRLAAISTTLDEQGVNKLNRADYEGALGTLMEIISSIDSRTDLLMCNKISMVPREPSPDDGVVSFAHADGEAVAKIVVFKRAMLQFKGNALRRDKEVIVQHCQEVEEISQLRERCRRDGITGAAVFTLTKTAATLACSRLLEEIGQTFLNVLAFPNHTEDNFYHPGGFSKTNPLTI